jgi:peptide/nickel transport system ATP-binding protein
MKLMQTILEVEQLTKEYSIGGVLSRQKILANDAISFHVNAAEVFVLAGESGCGKTTAAKIILGFEEPTAGLVVHNGKRGAKNTRPWIDEGVQAIFQDPFATFNPLRKVDCYFFETVRNFRLASGRKEAISLIEEKLLAIGMSYDEIAGKYPSEFSGGQLQRISIARALMTDPVMLIADEPVSMVDASLRMSIVNLFKKLRDEIGVSVLYITHDLATAYYVGDRIAVMFRGSIIEMGPAEEVLMHPRHPYTKLLRDSIPEADPSRKWQSTVTLSDTDSEEFMRMGCKFAGRCPVVEGTCGNTAPADIEDGQVLVKCHRLAQSANNRAARADR